MKDINKISKVSRETLSLELNQFLNIANIELANTGNLIFPQVDKKMMGLYPVVDSVEMIEALLKYGVKTVQLRIKDPATVELEQQIKTAIRLGRDHQAQVFINDYWQLAIKHGAYGVHLGQEDLDTADLDALQTAGLRLGISTHSFEELLVAIRLKPSYIALGHIFPTTTKSMPSKPQGLARLRCYQSGVNKLNESQGMSIPTVAIGGIDLTNAEKVLSCGVDSIAIVRAITKAKNVGLAVESFFKLLAQERFEEAISEQV